jgi:hypothetical protein
MGWVWGEEERGERSVRPQEMGRDWGSCEGWNRLGRVSTMGVYYAWEVNCITRPGKRRGRTSVGLLLPLIALHQA